jgi:hypothetical protein
MTLISPVMAVMRGGGHGRDNLREVMEDFRRGHNAPVRLFRKVLI